NLILLETSKVFLQCASEHSRALRLLVQKGEIPLPSDGADRFISLAGLHHLTDKPAFFREVRRCLKPGGIFALSDAYEGSGTGGFLNEFVHAHSEEGHEGIFLNAQTVDEVTQSGYRIISARSIAYPWKFASIADMVECCRLMFGITRATPEAIEGAVRHYL